MTKRKCGAALAISRAKWIIIEYNMNGDDETQLGKQQTSL